MKMNFHTGDTKDSYSPVVNYELFFQQQWKNSLESSHSGQTSKHWRAKCASWA